MTVIEADGTNLQPLVVDSLEIFVGARCPKLVIYSLNQRRNRSTILGCCKMLFFTLARDCVPDMFVGHCGPASRQLLYVFRLLLVVRINA